MSLPRLSPTPRPRSLRPLLFLTGINTPPSRAGRPPGRLRLLAVGTAVVAGGGVTAKPASSAPALYEKSYSDWRKKSYRHPLSSGRRLSATPDRDPAMSAYRRVCPYDHEADLLQAWCRRYGFDALALFNGDGRAPEIWRDDVHAWWIVPLPDGGQVIVLVNTGQDIRNN